MLKESIAARYSEALFSLAKERDALQGVTGQLDGVVALLEADAQLWAFFESPVVDRPTKERFLETAFGSQLNELTLNFILLLVRKRRENLIGIVARQMHELLDEAAGRKIAAIGTPLPLAPNQLDDLARRLSAVYAAQIVPRTKLSPELLGGLVVQVGDRYVDASVAGKLEELSRQLLAGADRWGTTSPNGKSQGS